MISPTIVGSLFIARAVVAISRSLALTSIRQASSSAISFRFCRPSKPVSHLGPFDCNTLVPNSQQSIPLESRSTGLSVPGPSGTSPLISSTRSCTNGFYSFSLWKIQHQAILKSVQHINLSVFISGLSASFMLWITLDRTTAGNSSRLGMVCFKRDSSRVLEDTSLT